MPRFINDIDVSKQVTTSNLMLNGSSSGKTSVVSSNNITTNNTITFPAISGTVSLTSHTHNYAGSSSVGGPATSANKVNKSLTLKFDTGTSEGTSLYTFDGSTSKTLDIKGGTNVSISKASGVVTINSSYIDTTYSASTGLNLSGTAFSVKYGTTAGTAAQGNDGRLSNARTPVSHTHGLISNEGKIGVVSDLVIMTGANGVLETKPAGTNSNYLRGDGSWVTPPDTKYTASTGIKLTGTKFEHTNSIVSSSVGDGGSARTLAWSGKFNIPTVSYDAQGHLTSTGSVAITIPSNPDTTYSVGNGLTSSGTVFSMGTPSNLTASTSNATTASSHTHSISTASAVSQSNSTTNTEGSSASLARADHTHSITGFALSGHNHSSTYQPLDGDLTSIAGISGTSGFLKKTAANTWSLDTTNYLSLTGGTLTGTLNTRTVAPTANNTYDIGTSAKKYKDAYLSGKIYAADGGNIGGTLVLNDLTVNGTSFIVNSTVTTIDDPVIIIGGDTPPSTNDGKDRGVEYRWHNGSVAKLGYFGLDRSLGKFTFIPDATNTNEVFSGAAGTIVANLDGNVNGTVTNGVVTTGSYSDPSWLSISKSKVGLSNVENTKLSTWAGTSSITTLGSITSGSWNGSTIAVNRGGTGTTTLADNKLLIGNGTSAIQTDTNLHWDTTNDRLGVRNTAPAETVHVNGNVRVDDSAGNVGFVMAYDNVSKSLQFNFAG